MAFAPLKLLFVYYREAPGLLFYKIEVEGANTK
jgi:hypothetical protein